MGASPALGGAVDPAPSAGSVRMFSLEDDIDMSAFQPLRFHEGATGSGEFFSVVVGV